MPILDPNGNWVTSDRFAHGADRSPMRGHQYPVRDMDIDKLIPSNDRKTLVSLSKRLFTNIGVPKEVIAQKADYSVGEAWIPSYTGPDKEAGDEVEAWFKDAFMPSCDVRGGIHNWHQSLNSVSMDIDFGDSFTLLTHSEDESMPQIQFIPSHRVDSCGDRDTVTRGDYAGEVIKDGIIYNRQQRAIAYRVTQEGDRRQFNDIPAQSIVHMMDPDFTDQGRGFPAFTHAIEDLKQCLQSTEYERIRQLIISSIGLIEYNERGGPDPEDVRSYLDGKQPGACGAAGVTVQRFEGGAVRYMRANSGEKLEVVKHDNPGDVWESFQDRMIRMSVIGAGWSYSMVWKGAGQGTAERADVMRARRAVLKRQRLLALWARRVTSYAVAYAQEKGELRDGAGRPVSLYNPTLWAFSRPPRITVDDGREDTMLINGWRAGTRNLTEVVEANGHSMEEFTEQRAREIALRKIVARRVSEEASKASGYDIQIENREMAMLTANEMPPQDNPPQDNPPKE